MAAGFLLSAETASALEALDLTELPLTNMRQRRMLLVGRSGPRVDAKLRAFLDQEGAEATVASGPGYRERGEFIERVDSWLRAGAPHRARLDRPVAPPQPEGSFSAPAGQPSVSKHLTLDLAGIDLRETPMWIDGPGERLFGVLAEPLNQPSPLGAILLTAGSRPHTGPCRLWVTIARQWAARGVPTLRFDMPGIGDSHGQSDAADASKFCELMPLSRPEYLRATSAALDMLASRGLPERFLLVGFDSGAYWALHSALNDERVAAAIMFNPPALVWNEEINEAYRSVQLKWGARILRSRLLRSETWRRVLTGEIAPARCLSLAWGLGIRPALKRQPGYGEVAATSESAALLDALRDRDQTGLLMLTGDEPLREEFVKSGLLDRSDRWPNLELVLTGEADDAHSLTPLWAQHLVLALAERVLDRELVRAAEQTTVATQSGMQAHATGWPVSAAT
jgi:alpha/beta superfamily hydrolase